MTRRETGEGKTRTLAAGQHTDAFENVVAAEKEAGQMVACLLFVHQARVAHRVQHGLVAGQLALRLRKERDTRRRRRLDVAVEWGEVAHQRAHERRLPRAIGAHDGYPPVASDPERAGPDEGRTVPDRERRGLYNGVASEMRRLEAPAVTRHLFRRLDPLDPGELLGAAARLLRALPGAVAAYELLGPRDLFGLLRRGLGSRGVTVRALPRIGGIAAAVFDDRATFERERAAGDAIEKPAVVTGYKERRVLLDQEPLEPLERCDVEMVGRLVKQQQVGVVEQQPRETESRAFAARERP